MTKLILDEINKKHKSSGGKCGLTPIQLCNNIGLSYTEIKETLNDLHQNNKIKVRYGVNSFLLFKA